MLKNQMRIVLPRRSAVWFLTSLSVLILAASCASAEQQWSGKCVGVADGDTISAMHNGKEERIRITRIDCPESGQAFGARAKQFTSSLVFGKVISVHPSGTDRYGRTLAEVILPDGRNLGEEIIKNGWGWWFIRYDKDDEPLKQMEAEARAAKRGLWADPHPLPPWEFRHPPH